MSSLTENPPHFSTIDLSGIVGGASAAIRRIPQEPGVYAFFRQLKISNQQDADAFVDEVLALSSQPAANNHTARCGPLHNVGLSSSSTLSSRKEAQLRELSNDSSFRKHLATTLSACTMLQAPLYVGKADQLRNRINSHLDPTSDLSTRLREVGIYIDKCVLAYTLIDDVVSLPDSSLFLYEEIISRICRPGFVLRIG